MAVDVNTLDQFDGKQVILHKVVDGSLVELEGKVEAASPAGIAFKEKGKRDVDLVMPGEIEEIALAPEKPKRISQKKLKPTTENTVRQHLVDRHGVLRSEVNNMSDAEAFELHENTDHDDLGHRHESDDDEAGEQDEAGEAGESESDDAENVA